jgi:uncharacterized protein YyaL (SSP411 family)
MEATRMTNRLASEPSPYLRQHKDNAVDWWPWSDAALEEAKRQQKPLFVSIGYASCHWCHVMAHESFENPDIAALMNEWFINIKVDREERPDVDAVYMSAVQGMTGSGGWPLNVFATPDGVPFFGGTYWPPTDMRGMPGFPRILQAIHEAWTDDREQLLENANRVLGFLREQEQPISAAASGDPGEAAIGRLEAAFDAEWGGFGGAPKFPQTPTLEFLARRYQRTGATAARTMLTTTLDRMAAGGIHDQLGGGFARYSVDATWTVPHFEKMLYDNAQLMHVYLDAWIATGVPRYAEVVIDTGRWLLREMLLAGGGFASALDADSEGREGAYYVWSDRQIDAILPPDHAAVVRQRFGITPEGNFEGENVLTLAATLDEIADVTGQPAERVAELLAAGATILREHRNRRGRPAQDDKVVTAWNGEAIGALALAGAVLCLPAFLDAARQTARYLLDQARDDDGRLWRMTRQGERRGSGVLEDYTFLAEGLIHLHQADGDIHWLDEASALMDTAIRDFGRDDGPGFYDTPHGSDDLAIRPQSIQDNATPSGNAVAADVLLTLGTLTERRELVDRAAALVESMGALMERHPEGFGRYLAVAERLAAPTYTLVIGGDPESPGHARLTRTALSYPSAALVIAHATPELNEAELARFPVLQDRGGKDGASAAWLCREGACMLPAVSSADLGERLAEMETELSAAGA